MKDRLFEIWFSLRCGVQNKEFQPLLEQYGSPYEIYHADEAEIERLPCSQNLKNRLNDKSLDEADRIMEYCRRNGVGILFWSDGDYPVSLRPLRDPPVLLYYQGKLPDLNSRLCVSVVGTRRMSEYGKRMAYKIGYELAAVGTVVVSGLALGNDSVASAGALAAGGNTVAVLGCGIDTVYPREHTALARRIEQTGCVMTEFPPTTPPAGHNFPIRNRIISGLSQGTVVVECDQRSGALITARTAILQGRTVYAFPGNVGETNAAGSNRLLIDGAVLILSAADVLEEYTFLYRDQLDMVKLKRAEARSELNEEFLDSLGVCARTPEAESAASSLAARPEKPRRDAPPEQKATSSREAPRSAAESTEHKTHTRGKGRPAVEQTPIYRTPPTLAKASGDLSQQLLATLTETQRRIFEVLPLDHAVPIDYVTREGFTVGEVMSAMTVLEIKGLTVTLPGGLYSRK